MITKLKIENFKGFEKLEIENTSYINLIGGQNNIGKSSLLEVIFSYFDRFGQDPFIKQLSWRGILQLNLAAQKQYELWSPIFNNYDLDKIIKIDLVIDKKEFETLTFHIDKDYVRHIPKKDLSSTTSVSGTTQSDDQYALQILGKSTNEKTLEVFYYFSEKGLHANFIVRKINKVIPANFISSRMLNAIHDSVKYGDLMKDGKEELVLKALQNIEPRLKSISPVPMAMNNTILHGNIGLAKITPLYYLGDGIGKMLSFILAILTSHNGVVFIDEIENGFHYTKHEKVWQILFQTAREFNVQIFATTHSLEMIKAFNKTSLNYPEYSSYYELFRHHETEKIQANYLDNETLSYKILNDKPLRGE